jgi:SAM-dependent methyltransferase
VHKSLADLRRRLARRAKASRELTLLARIALDRASVVRDRFRPPVREVGATHRNLDLEQSLAYIDQVCEDYLEYGGLAPSRLQGARVLEVGPGDNMGVALRFLEAGASHVTAIDRFVTARDPVQQRQIYRALIERVGGDRRAALEAAVSLNPEVTFEPSRLKLIEGVGIEEAPGLLPVQGFDLVISRSVLQHVTDLDQAFAAMDALLAPGGTMAHRVDLRDLGAFSGGDLNPLTFLTIPERLYRWMSESTGIVNRLRIDYYRAKLEELGYSSRFFVTRALIGGEIRPHPPLLGDEEMRASERAVAEIRPKLTRRFRDLPSADLAIAGFFLAARKPSG